MPEDELLVNLLLFATSLVLGIALTLVTTQRPEKAEAAQAEGGERRQGVSDV